MALTYSLGLITWVMPLKTHLHDLYIVKKTPFHSSYMFLSMLLFLQATSCWQISCWISWKSPPPAGWSTWPRSPTLWERWTSRTWTGRRRSLILSRRIVRASLPMFCSLESSPSDYKASGLACWICGQVWERVQPMFLFLNGQWTYIFRTNAV